MEQIDILGIDLFKDGTLNSGLYVNKLSAHLTQSHRHINRPHKHDFYAVILFTKGSGTHEIEFTQFDVKPGAIFFLAPGQTHNWSLSEDAEGFVLFHSGEFYNSQYSNLNIDNYIFYSHTVALEQLVLSSRNLDEAIKAFEEIIDEKATAQTKSRDVILSLLTRLYVKIERSVNPTADTSNAYNSYHAKYARFLELLEAHYAEEKSARQYADWLHISPKHLNRINKTLLDKTTSEIIAERVVLEAKRMLLYTSLNFTEIAAGLGYPDYAYFSKLFRKHAGESPSQFIRRYSEIPQTI